MNQCLLANQTEGGVKTFFAQIKNALGPGTKIPRTNYVVKGFGERRGQAALVYLIPNSHAPSKPSEKGVNESEWQQAHDQLMQSGYFSRKWFNAAMSECAKGQPCNFSVIGSIFVWLGIADYEESSHKYIRKGCASASF
jgi:hypothetical protein